MVRNKSAQSPTARSAYSVLFIVLIRFPLSSPAFREIAASQPLRLIKTILRIFKEICVGLVPSGIQRKRSSLSGQKILL